MGITIRKLSKDLLDDYLHFFDDIAFCDNPSWSMCYCCFFYFSDDRKWDCRKKSSNRKYAVKQIRKGKLNGFLAYDEKGPIGWCNADIKTNYSRIMDDEDIPFETEKKVGSIVCFTIDHKQRGKGVATALLEAACDYFAKNDFDLIEAYPQKIPRNAAENFYGPLIMYEKAGFEIIREAGEHFIVQKRLG